MSSSSSDESSISSSSEEEPEFVKKDVPSRATRGSRMSSLIGEAAEADEAFWGQDAWNVDDEDAEYTTEDEEVDVVDDDFDLEEIPDEEVHDTEETEGRRTRNKKRTTKAYQEPYRVKKPRTSSSTKSSKKASAAAIAGLIPNRTLRASTTMKSSAFAEKCESYAKEMSSKISEKPKVPVKRLTQQQMLAEAVRTELHNTQSLNRLQAIEDEKKIVDAAPKAPYTGGMIRFHSKIGMPKTYTFVSTSAAAASDTDLDLFYRRDDRHHRRKATSSSKNHHHRHHRLTPGNHHHHHHSRVVIKK